jgi:hypothetical protein
MNQNTSTQIVSLEFLPGDGESAQIVWRSDSIGRRPTLFTSPYDSTTLPVVIKALDAQQSERTLSQAHDRTILETVGLWKNNQLPKRAPQIVGEALYQALGIEGQQTLREIRNREISERAMTTYVLRFPVEAVHLAALPWELLRDRQGFVLLGESGQGNSFERYLDLDRAVSEPLSSQMRPHLLALLPNHDISTSTRIQEQQARLASWNRLHNQGLITFDEINPLTRQRLTEYMRTAPRKPDIVHYFGHGIYNDGEGQLLFDTNDGSSTMVSAEQLRQTLQGVRLIVLHACHSSAIRDDGGLLTGIAPALSVIADAVVAMQVSVRIEAATRFSELFYDEILVRRRSLQEAVAIGRQSLFVEEEETNSWYVPTLYMRGREQRPLHMLEPTSTAGSTRIPGFQPPTPTLKPLPRRRIQATETVLETLRLQLIPGDSHCTLLIENLNDQEIQQLHLNLRGEAVMVSPARTNIARIPAHEQIETPLSLSLAAQTHQAQIHISTTFRVVGQPRPVRAEGMLSIPL